MASGELGVSFALLGILAPFKWAGTEKTPHHEPGFVLIDKRWPAAHRVNARISAKICRGL